MPSENLNSELLIRYVAGHALQGSGVFWENLSQEERAAMLVPVPSTPAPARTQSLAQIRDTRAHSRETLLAVVAEAAPQYTSEAEVQASRQRINLWRYKHESANTEVQPGRFAVIKGFVEATHLILDRPGAPSETLRAQTRLQISEIMWKRDQQLTPSEKNTVKARQIHRYYGWQLKRPEVRALVDAPHGMPLQRGHRLILQEPGSATMERHTLEIAKETPNAMWAKLSRRVTDVNALLNGASTLKDYMTLYHERICLEYNLNAVKGQRDLLKDLFGALTLTDTAHQLQEPYLYTSLHGKVADGYEVCIAGRTEGTQRFLHPQVESWVMESLPALFQKYLPADRQPSLHLARNGERYRGSAALLRFKYGDGVLDHEGFGDQLQLLQIELAPWLRLEFPQTMAQILTELGEGFTQRFTSPLPPVSQDNGRNP